MSSPKGRWWHISVGCGLSHPECTALHLHVRSTYAGISFARAVNAHDDLQYKIIIAQYPAQFELRWSITNDPFPPTMLLHLLEHRLERSLGSLEISTGIEYEVRLFAVDHSTGIAGLQDVAHGHLVE